MADYRLSENEPERPCLPKEHNFAMNGKCWRCNHYRDDLLRDARELLELSGQRDRYCRDCRRQLPSGHPGGSCPARDDSDYF